MHKLMFLVKRINLTFKIWWLKLQLKSRSKPLNANSKNSV